MEGPNRCDLGKKNNKEKFYHWDVGNKDSIAKFKEKLEEDMDEYFHWVGAMLHDVLKQSKIKYKPNALDKHSDVYNIDFIASGNSDEDMSALCFFSSLVTEELKLHNMPLTGSLEEHRDALRCQLLVEEMLQLIKQAIDCSELGKAAALILIKQAIPCIMHLENQVEEKILTILLSIGANLYQRRRATSSIQNYIEEVERIASRVILGTEWRPNQWRVPLTENQELASISLSNTKT
jgi:hypothetical protein